MSIYHRRSLSLNRYSWLIGLSMILGGVCIADDGETRTLRSTTGHVFEVFVSDLREAYLSLFGKSKNYDKLMENEDGTVTLMVPKYRFKDINYPVAMFHNNKETASGICKLYGFSANQLYERDLTKNIICAYIDEGGHFAGLRESHMESGKESMYDCLEKISCIR